MSLLKRNPGKHWQQGRFWVALRCLGGLDGVWFGLVWLLDANWHISRQLLPPACPPFPSPPYYHTLLPTRPSISPKTTLEYYPSQNFTHFATFSVANCSVSPKAPPKTLLILVLPPTTACPSISPKVFALPVPVFHDCSMITAHCIKTISLLDEFLY